MRSILVILLLFGCEWYKGQAPNKFFTTFGGEGVDIGYGIKEIYNRQYIIAGSTTSYGAGSADAYLILSDSMGNLVWQKTYGSVLAEVARSVIFNPADSGFILAGYTSSYGAGGYDVYVVRTDKHGNMLWQSAFGGLDWDFGQDLILTTDDNVIVCGKTYSEGYGKTDGYVLKVNLNSGALMWKKTFGGIENDDFVSIIKTTDGNYTMCGNTRSYGDVNGDFWLFKINTNGDSALSVNFGNLGKAEYCYDFIQDTDGDLMFCGSFDTSYANIGKNVSYIIKTDLNGNYLGEFKEVGAFTDDDKMVAISNSRNGDLYFLARKVNHVGPEGIDIQPITYDYNHTFLNATTYGDVNEDEAFDATYTSDNGFVVIGYTKGFKSMSENVFLLKMEHSLLNAQSVVGVEEIKPTMVAGSFYFYNGVFYLKDRDFGGYSYQIRSMDGKAVQQGTGALNNIVVNSELAPGIYILSVQGKELQQRKFIKE